MCSNAVFRMAFSVARVVFSALLLFSTAQCATKTYDFDLSWVSANPDGLYERSVIGINGQWPIPTINVTKGDRVIVNVKNSLGNESASLHFHGLFQNGTTHMDGPAQVSQCAIMPGSSFTYNFTVSILSIPHEANADPSGRPTWYLLVSLARESAVSGRSPWTLHSERSRRSSQGPLR